MTNGKLSFFKEQARRFNKHRSIIWFILPAFILAFVFGYIPMAGTIIAFTKDYNGVRYLNPLEALSHTSYTFAQFKKLLTEDIQLWPAIANTLIINVFKIIIVFPATIILAVLLAEIKKTWLSRTILIIICIPHFLSWSVVIGIWAGILSPDVGVISTLFNSNIWFFNSDAWFKPIAIFLSMWKSIGWSSILFYAAIIAIDKSFYEAAYIDGINKFQKALHLTLPTIMPTIALMFVMNITYIMDAGFEQIWAMMSMGSSMRDSQRILGTYIYEISMAGDADMSFATAVGVFNGLIALILMLTGNAIVKKTLKTSLW